MSSFLINLARRGAGLPATKIQAPPPSPLGPGMHNQGDEPAEEAATSNTANQTPLPGNYSDEYRELPAEAAIPHTPSIQHFYGIEPNTSLRPSIEELTAVNRTPSLGSPPTPQRHVIPFMREAEVVAIEPPERQEPAVPPFQAGRAVIAPVTQTIGPVNEPERQESPVVSSSPILTKEPGETQVISLSQPSYERPRDEARETCAPALSVAMIRPALAEFPTLLQFPKVTPASAPTPPAQLPIHVRIGRVEVRGTTAPTPMPARPSAPAPVGFAAYYRMRNYRS